MDERSEIAALRGIAENDAYPVNARLQCALSALERMSKLVPEWDDE